MLGLDKSYHESHVADVIRERHYPVSNVTSLSVRKHRDQISCINPQISGLLLSDTVAESQSGAVILGGVAECLKEIIAFPILIDY